MKNLHVIFKLPALLIIILSVVISCRKDDSVIDYSYFVSKELSVSYNKTYINSLIDVVSGSIPEVEVIKPLVKSDVDIYRIVYKTTMDGKKINASGLVCVPSVAGEYPVISFQNGTNTVNTYAPSEFALNYSYQLIEILASMGYIVVIADYPGFGESAQVPHPYLIKEPTVQSLVDLLYSVNEATVSELPDITVKNEYYLLGYSQGGWATLALHKALEIDYSEDFYLMGSACGAGPYNIYLLLQEMVNATEYPMPVYLGYIVNAYSSYKQFMNPVSDIFNEPYATRLNSLYNGKLSSQEINGQLSTSIGDLINPEFLSGFSTLAKYSGIRDALINNSISAWHTYKPLMLLHGENDTQVNPVSTENMYSEMIQAGTSPDICKKVIIPNADHGDGVAPAMIEGIMFLLNIGK